MRRSNVDLLGISFCVSVEIRYELSFWLRNIHSVNGRPMSLKSSAVGVVYSDASDTGFGGFFV